MTPYDRSDVRSGWAVLLGSILLCALVLLGIAASGGGCTTAQREPFRKAAAATTQVTDHAVTQTVATATGTSPYLAIVSGIANAVLGVLLLLEKRKPKTNP